MWSASYYVQMIHSWSMNKLRIHFCLFFPASWSNWQDSFRKFLTVFQFTGFLVSKCRVDPSRFSQNCMVNWLIWFHLILTYFFNFDLSDVQIVVKTQVLVLFTNLVLECFVCRYPLYFWRENVEAASIAGIFTWNTTGCIPQNRQQVHVFWMTVFSKAWDKYRNTQSKFSKRTFPELNLFLSLEVKHQER